jgi:DNA-binding Lrp family transcriptional regulator
MPLKADLDAIDWKILRELQADGRMTNVELSNRVGISAPPCLRRVKRLEEAGIIRGYRALLNAPALGLDVVAFCLVGLHHQADAERIRFPAALRGKRPRRLPDLRHRGADLDAECRYGAHRAHHPPGQG